MAFEKDLAKDSELGSRMRDEWNRRVEHDYRYWMSDGVENDQVMWQTGERDLPLLTARLNTEESKQLSALELGCGVGRLLKPASDIFAQVTGIDVSTSALAEAQRLVGGLANVSLVEGDGNSLNGVDDDSIDFVFSFAAIGSMPSKALSNYLVELARVLKNGGKGAFQLYLGREQEVFEEDTLSLRSYEQERLILALQAVGCIVDGIEELVLPFEVSDFEKGIVAKIVYFQKTRDAKPSSEEVHAQLLSTGEQAAPSGWQGSYTEYLMAVARAHQHLEGGRKKEALQALEFAVSHYDQVEEGVISLLGELRLEFSSSSSSAAAVAAPASSSVSVALAESSVSAEDLSAYLGNCYRSDIFEANLKALKDTFPEVYESVVAARLTESVSVQLSESNEPVVLYQGRPLANLQKPTRGAEAWAERELKSKAYKDAGEILLLGFGVAYHIEAIVAHTNKTIRIFETEPQVVRAALAVRDLRNVFERVSSFHFGVDEMRELLKGEDVDELALLTFPQTQAVMGDSILTLKRLLQSERGLRELRPNIAIVGPMYGGSLPIAGYAYRALQGLNQRVSTFDLSGFYDSFRNFEAFLPKKDTRNNVENQYVETLSQLVLDKVALNPVDIVICLAQAPLTPRALTELRNRGIITAMWFVEDCARFETWKSISPYYDYMFLIQRDGWIKQVEDAGAGRAVYLPVACDPGIHAPVNVDQEEVERWGSDVSFVGAGYNNRLHMFSPLANFDFKIWGTEWPDMLPFRKIVQEGARRISPEEYVKIFNTSKINLNLHSSKERDGVEPYGDFVNPRTFELASTGAFQLVDNRRYLPELFEIGEELITFADQKELEDKIGYYLAHPEERQLAAEKSRTRALSEHTYAHRIRDMLECIYSDHYQRLKERSEEGHWPKTIKAAEEYPELQDMLEKARAEGLDPKLDSLVAQITMGKGNLSMEEMKILFLHHLKSQIGQIKKMRNEPVKL